MSVIIPTFNRKLLISRAIKSVLNQTFKAFEIIVVDDGSTDGSGQMIKEKFPQVILFKQNNQGVSNARNKGVKISQGTWVAFLDSDDEWHKTKLEKQIQYLKINKDIKFCHTNEVWIRDDIIINQKKKHQKYGGKIFSEMLDMCRISPSSVLIFKNIFEEISYFNENLKICEDYDLWLKISSKKNILFIDMPLINKYGGHEGQLSSSANKNGIEYFRIKSLIDILENFDLEKEHRLVAIEMLIKKMRIYLKGLIKRSNTNDIKDFQSRIRYWNNQLDNHYITSNV